MPGAATAPRPPAGEGHAGGVPIPHSSTKRDAFHLILSMPTQTDPLAVQRAARAFATREFSTSQYAMVLHTFETDPDPNPSRHPHVHLTVKTAGLDGIRLNPRKADLQRWREGFAEALRDQGIDATTTSRLHRTTHDGGRCGIAWIRVEPIPQHDRPQSSEPTPCLACPTRGDAEL